MITQPVLLLLLWMQYVVGVFTFGAEVALVDDGGCGPGTYCLNGTCSTCVPCLHGTYQNEVNESECIPCPPGHFASANGSTACTACEMRRVCPDGGCTQCIGCPIGWETNHNRTACNACPGGTFSNAGTSYCRKCRAGTFCPANGACASCTDCQHGMYQNSPGKVQCEPCPRGWHQRKLGQASCVQCPPGTFQTSVGSSSCRSCPADYYCAFYATSVPAQCPDDAYCPADSTRPKGCASLFTVNDARTGCRMGGSLIGIILVITVMAVGAATLLAVRSHKRKAAARRMGEHTLLYRPSPTYEGF